MAAEPVSDELIVRIQHNCFDGQRSYDAQTELADGTKIPTVTRVPRQWALREIAEHKKTPERCVVAEASEADLTDFEATVKAGKPVEDKKKK